MLLEWIKARLAVARLGGKELQLAIGIEGFARALDQLRLVIKSIHMAHASRAEDLDDTFRLCCVVPAFRRKRTRGGGITMKQRGQRGSAETLQEMAAVNRGHEF